MILVAFHIYEGLRDRAFFYIYQIFAFGLWFIHSLFLTPKKRPNSGALTIKEL